MIPRVLVGAALVAALTAPPASAAPLTVSGLTANREAAPLGLGDARPALGWKLGGDGRGRAQVRLPGGGQQRAPRRCGTAARSTRPPPPTSPTAAPRSSPAPQYTWRVRVWDETNTPSAYSAPAALETGLLEQSDWTAKWIAAPADDLDLAGARWIWFTGDDAANNLPAMTRYLRATVNLATKPAEARLLFTVDDEAIVYVNGTQVIDTKRHPRRRRERLAEGAAPRRGRAPASRAEHDRRAGQEPAEPHRRTDAGRLHRPPAGGTRRPSTRAAPGSRARPAPTAGSSPASTTPPGRPRVSSRPTAAAPGARTSASRPSPARTCARTSRRPSRSRRRACT